MPYRYFAGPGGPYTPDNRTNEINEINQINETTSNQWGKEHFFPCLR